MLVGTSVGTAGERQDGRNWMWCDRRVRRTYVGPTGRCWGSGSWGTAPGVCPGDLVLYGCSLPIDQRNNK